MSTLTRTSSATPVDPHPNPSALPKPPASRVHSFRSGMQPPPPPPGPSDANAMGFSAYAVAGNSLALPTPAASGSSASSKTSNGRAASPAGAPVAGPASGFAASPAPAAAPSPAPAAAPRTGNVIDLTSSSPPSSSRRRQLPAAALASGLDLPGSPRAGPSGAGAGTSGGAGVRSYRRARFADTAARAADRREEVTLSSGSDTSDSEYAPPARRAGAGGASTSAVLVEDSDSDVEIVSVGPVRPPAPRQPGFNDVLGSPPPYVVPPGATATSSRPRRSARRTRAASVDPDDSDAALARELAAEEDEYADYLAAQERAFVHAGTGAGHRAAYPPGAGLAARAHHGAGWGIFSPSGGLGGATGAQALLDNLRFLQQFATGAGGHGGGFWPGAGGGGGAGGMYGAGHYGGPQGGWGGAAKVKAASRKYAVRMSHPGKIEAGFARDVVEPPDPDEPASVPSPAKKRKGKKGKEVEVVEMEPVCASCVQTLRLDGEGAHKVFVLRCGHAVCARCLDEARERCRAIRDAEKGATARRGGAKGKGKGRAAVVVETDDEDDDEAPPPARAKGKGKARSRADETGVEEDWTTCPVAACDGKGTDLLATEGWARPFELFA
ncbi:hypothetical protein JCM10450v2_008006 [Rhodotorula kratochvilovae]